MRQLILDNLNNLKNKNRFTKDDSRWAMFFINGIHISIFCFEDLNDEELLNCYDRVMRQFYL